MHGGPGRGRGHGRGGFGGGPCGPSGGHHGGRHGGFGGPGFGPRGPPPGPVGGIFGAIFGPPVHAPPPRGFFRPGPPPPMIGRPGFRYHHPHVVPAVFVAGAVAAASLSPLVFYATHNDHVCGTTLPPSVNADHLVYYSVTVPPDVFPGEVFRVAVDRGREVLVTCPSIDGPGAVIVIAVEEIPPSAPISHGHVVPAAAIVSAPAAEATSTSNPTTTVEGTATVLPVAHPV